jgi:DNA mismatch repair ATPase MutS
MKGSVLLYMLIFLLFVWFIAFLTYYLKTIKLKKELKKIRDDWGKQKAGYRNYDLIESFSQRTTTIPFHQLNEQTINDLDIHELFAFIDRTNSKPGQQYLYNKLIKPTNDITGLETFNRQVNFFTEQITDREDAQVLLGQLNHSDAYYITTLLKDKLLVKPKWANLLVFNTIAVIAMLILSVKFPVLLIWLIPVFGINIFFHYRNKSNINKFIKSFPQLIKLIYVSGSFIKKGLPFDNTGIQKNIGNLKGFKRKYKLLSFADAGDNEIAQFLLLLLELTKAFFLVEIHSFFSTLKELENKKTDINSLLNYTGNIDAALSTASLRAGLTSYTTPAITAHKKELIAKDLYHPLIENCIVNSITIKQKSILITGSNMSGKSTFIRAVAINAVLAQTIYTCLATEFATPILKVFSSIRITDNVQDGKSYYFEEVNTIGNLIEASGKPFQNLFIIDEVFKGTNTIERVAAAKAILTFLNKNENIILVSSHDIELVELLHPEFELYHFVENIENDNLVFDHRLKPGPLKSRNAIKILSISNYPAEIIEEANRIANKN